MIDTMTSDPDHSADEKRLRALIADRLRTTPRRRGATEQEIENERIWRRASEQERRRMLKDCGWL